MTNQEIMIKRAGIEDLDDILNLLTAYRKFYRISGENYKKLMAFISQRLEKGESVIFLAYDKNIAVGIAQLYANFTTLGLGKIWSLNDLFVAENVRSQGIGRLLIDSVMAFSKKDGAVRVDIKTEKTNIPAKALYEKYGFKKDEVFDQYSYSFDR